MSYRLEDREGVADGIRRIVAEELDDAIAGLRAGDDRDTAIHEARKSLKKARSALRLARTDLPASTRRTENAAMRDASRRLSGARDAQVMLDTLEGLTHAIPAPPADEVRSLGRELADRRADLASQLEGDTGLLEDVAGELEAIRGRVASWELGDQGWGSIAEGAEIIHDRGRAAMKQALRGDADDDWHEWRKRVKDLWYAGRIIAPITGPQIEGLVEEADELSDVLGDHNDLAVLLEAAGDRPGLRAAIVARRDGLRRRRGHAGPPALRRAPEGLRPSPGGAAGGARGRPRGVGALADPRSGAEGTRAPCGEAVRRPGGPAAHRDGTPAARAADVGLRVGRAAAGRRLRDRGPRAVGGARDRARGRAARSRDARRPLGPRSGRRPTRGGSPA